MYRHFIIHMLLLIVGLRADAQTSSQLLDSAEHYKSVSAAKTMQFAQQAYFKAMAEGGRQQAADAMLLMGLGNYIGGNHDAALQHYMEAEKMYTALRDTAGLTHALSEMCIVYTRQRKFGNADEVSRMAVAYALASENTDGLANSYNNRGLMFLEEQQNDSAEVCFRKAYYYYSRISSAIGMSYSLDYMSSILADKGRLDEALSYLKSSRSMRMKGGDKMGEAIAINNIGELLLQQNKPRDALPYFTEARSLAALLDFKDLLAHTYNMEASTQEQTGHFEQAYKALRSYQDLHEEIINEKRVEAIEEMQARYETEKKEQENRLLLERNKVQALQISRRNIALAAAAALIVLVAGIGYLFYNRYRLRQQARLQQELLHQQQLRTQAIIDTEEAERQRLARELHDGVGQLLAAARRRLQHIPAALVKATEHIEDDETPIALLDESIREVRQLSHSMMPPALRNKSLVQALDELAARIRHSTNLSIETEWVNTEQLILNKNQTLMLYRAVQEIISNTIKHAQASAVHLELVNHETELSLMIYDDGKGFDKNAGGTGLGLKNIASRIGFIGGTVELDTRPGKGVTYIIDLPLTDTKAT